MAPHIPMALATLTLIAVADPYAPAPADHQTVRPTDMAYGYGHTVGEASECGMIDRDRIDAAAEVAKARIKSAASQGDYDLLNISEQYDNGVETGRQAVLDGETSCADADTALQGIEAQARK